MVPFAEEVRDVGRERREHFEPFVATCIGFDEVAIVFKTLQIEGAQPFDQARVDQRRFLFPQIDSSVGADHRRNPSVIVIGEGKFGLFHRVSRTSASGIVGSDAHAAASMFGGMMASSLMRPIIRSSIASMPRTKDLTESVATSGIGLIASIAWLRISETASTSSPMS